LNILNSEKSLEKMLGEEISFCSFIFNEHFSTFWKGRFSEEGATKRLANMKMLINYRTNYKSFR